MRTGGLCQKYVSSIMISFGGEGRVSGNGTYFISF